MKAKFFAILTAVAFVVAGAGPAMALDMGVSTSTGQQMNRERSNSVKQTTENKSSTGSKSSSSRSRGSESQSQRSSRQSHQYTQSGALDMTVSLNSLFPPVLAKLERSGKYPSLAGQIITKPPLARNFGLSAEVQPGVIDSIKAQLLSSIAASNGSVQSAGGNEAALLQYKNELAYYGAVIAQAALDLSRDLGRVGQTRKDAEGLTEVRGLGYDDLVSIARGDVIRTLRQGIQSFKIRDRYQTIRDQSGPCRIAGNVTSIQCGSSLLQIGNPPVLTAWGMPLYGRGEYGLEGGYKISSGWSLSHVMERLESSSKYRKVGREIAEYADKLESHGKATEAAMVRKKAIEEAASGKSSLSLAWLIPGVH